MSAEASALSAPLDLRGQRIFITGATGFVGRFLLDYVRESETRYAGGPELWLLSRNPQDFQIRYPEYAGQPNWHWIKGELLSGDWQEVLGSKEQPLDEHNLPDWDSVLHAAAETHDRQDAVRWLDEIVDGTRRTLDLAVRSGARRFLLTSSGAVYGPQPADIPSLTETYQGAPSPQDVRSVYGEGKRMAELLCHLYANQTALETVVARCFAFVGEHMPLDGPYAMGNFLRDALYGEGIRILGDGTAERSYLHGRDMAHWLFTLLLKGQSGEAYNVGSDEGLSLRELAQLIVNLVAPEKRVELLGQPQPGAPRSRYLPSIQKAASLGLKVEISLDDAILRTVSALRERYTG